MHQQKIRLFVCMLIISIGFTEMLVSQTLNPVVTDDTSKTSLWPRMSQKEFDNELVQVTGVIVQWKPMENKTTVQYWLRDKWGTPYEIRSINSSPEINKSYVVIGIVTRDAADHFYLDERNRTLVGEGKNEEKIASDVLDQAKIIVGSLESKWWLDGSEAINYLRVALENYDKADYAKAKINATQAIDASRKASFSTIFYLIVLILIIVGILVTVFVMKRKPLVADQPQPMDLPNPEKITGKIIKIDRVPEGTLKVLPGRFEVAKGDEKVKEIRLFKVPGNDDLEFSIGRNTGQIDRKSVV